MFSLPSPLEFGGNNVEQAVQTLDALSTTSARLYTLSTSNEITNVACAL